MADDDRTDAPTGQIEETLLRATPMPATVADAVGVERIVEPEVARGWRAAPVNPNPEDIERMNQLNERFAKQSRERLGTYSHGPFSEGGTKTARRAKNAEPESAQTA